MKFSVVIPAYNEENYLPNTLAAIKIAAARINSLAEIIVVDNESADKTALIAESYSAKVILEKEHNIAKVRNTGAKSATGEVLIFIDADTLIPEILFQKIADVMTNEKCFGGAVAVDYEQFKRKWMKYYLLGWQFWGTLFNMKQGAAQFCRKSIFIELQGFDESIFVGEDVMFYWKLSKFTRQDGGFLHFIENPKVVTSSRRFDKMSLWKTFLLTHPVFILLTLRKKSFWKDWYEKAIR
jgi:cellulose synthase/poly-beta-1,6-N-acetylglucosamine synthase-like glycosyltransferase